MPLAQQQPVINHRRWDWYDLNFADDVQEATTNLTDGVPQNWILPYPADAEDPNEAILVKAIRVHVNMKGLSALKNVGTDPLTELFRIAFHFFEPDEVDETTEAHRDEEKEAIDWLDFINTWEWEDETNNNGGSGIYEVDKSLIFEQPVVFPLNIACKTLIVDGGDCFESPEHFHIRVHYRVVKNPLGFLGRILALMRQELSG